MTEQEFKILFDKYNKQLWAFAYSILKNVQEAEDVVQNVFVRLWELDDFSSENWLFLSVRRECYNHLKHIKRKTKHYKIILESYDEYCDAAFVKSELILTIVNEINLLPRAQKKIIEMMLQGFSYDEISKVLGITISTVRVQLSRFRKKYNVVHNEKKMCGD